MPISGYYTYTLDGNNATITAYSGAGGDITIPSTLDGHPVTALDTLSFVYLTSITSVVIPEGVIHINYVAFNGCTSLISVVIPSTVTTISDGAFANCPSLTSATFNGNTPLSYANDIFDNAATGFKIYYNQGTSGWTNPWDSYPTQELGNTTVSLPRFQGRAEFTFENNIFYANINNTYADNAGHDGSLGNEFSFTELNAHSLSNTSGNTYNIIGTRNLEDIPCGGYQLNIYSNTWQGYELSANGPWRVYQSTWPLTLFGLQTGQIKDGLFYTTDVDLDGGIYLNVNAANCLFEPGDDQRIWLNAQNINQTHIGINSCSFYNILENSTGTVPITVTFAGCSIHNIHEGCGTDTWTATNCAFADNSPSTINYDGTCVTGWDMPSSPAYNAPVTSFYASILNAGEDISYHGYPNGLWGETRTGIGAVYFNTVIPVIGCGPDQPIRFSKDRLIDLVEYLPQYLKQTETNDLVLFFQNYLNTMFTGLNGFTLSGSGGNPEHLKYIDPSNLSTEKISILERINRIVEMQDPTLVDLDYLQYLANNLGYNVNINRGEIGTILTGGTVACSAIEIDKQMRFVVENLPEWYRIKTTRNAIKVMLFSYGLIGDLAYMYTDSYLPISQGGNWVVNDYNMLNTDVNNVPKNYFSTPHFIIWADLDNPLSLNFDVINITQIINAINSMKPVNSVFHGLGAYLSRQMEISFSAHMRIRKYLYIPA